MRVSLSILILAFSVTANAESTTLAATVERAVANTPDTPFMIMSVSKQFTAALILRLVALTRS